MPKRGDSFIVPIGNAQHDWGTYRNPTNRPLIEGEAYFAIPKKYAIEYEIYNSNNPQVGLGYNEFYVTSRDGFLENEILLAQGCSRAGDPYAKNFAIKGDLKRLGEWFEYVGATTENSIKVVFTSPTEILLEII